MFFTCLCFFNSYGEALKWHILYFMACKHMHPYFVPTAPNLLNCFHFASWYSHILSTIYYSCWWVTKNCNEKERWVSLVFSFLLFWGDWCTNRELTRVRKDKMRFLVLCVPWNTSTFFLHSSKFSFERKHGPLGLPASPLIPARGNMLTGMAFVSSWTLSLVVGPLNFVFLGHHKCYLWKQWQGRKTRILCISSCSHTCCIVPSDFTKTKLKDKIIENLKMVTTEH